MRRLPTPSKMPSLAISMLACGKPQARCVQPLAYRLAVQHAVWLPSIAPIFSASFSTTSTSQVVLRRSAVASCRSSVGFCRSHCHPSSRALSPACCAASHPLRWQIPEHSLTFRRGPWASYHQQLLRESGWYGHPFCVCLHSRARAASVLLVLSAPVYRVGCSSVAWSLSRRPSWRAWHACEACGLGLSSIVEAHPASTLAWHSSGLPARLKSLPRVEGQERAEQGDILLKVADLSTAKPLGNTALANCSFTRRCGDRSTIASKWRSDARADGTHVCVNCTPTST